MLDKINEFLQGPLPRRILFFDDLLTPTLIRTLYWLGLLAVAWTGAAHFFTNGFFGMFEAMVYIVTGVIGLRVLAELVMLLFKINENLETIATKPASTPVVTATDPVSKPVKKKTKKKVSKKVAKKVSKKVSE